MGKKTGRTGRKNRKRDMKIQLWYSKPVSQWRWTLTSEEDYDTMESGNSENLRDAMNDVATTVEWLLDKKP